VNKTIVISTEPEAERELGAVLSCFSPYYHDIEVYACFMVVAAWLCHSIRCICTALPGKRHCCKESIQDNLGDRLKPLKRMLYAITPGIRSNQKRDTWSCDVHGPEGHRERIPFLRGAGKTDNDMVGCTVMPKKRLLTKQPAPLQVKCYCYVAVAPLRALRVSPLVSSPRAVKRAGMAVASNWSST
jgi:hypothetical protein